mgnify:FL=1
MNPVFVILVIVAAVIIWALLSIIYIPIGKLISKVWKNVTNNINKKDESEDK